MDDLFDDDMGAARQKPSRPKKVPRKVSQSGLMKSALYYLGKFAASRSGVRTVLWRKAQRSMAVHGGDEAEVQGWIDAVLDDLERQGWLNDRLFAESRARSLWMRGLAQRAIAMKLVAKGVHRDDIDHALQRLEDEAQPPAPPPGAQDDGEAPVGYSREDPDLDLAAAIAYARRRRLGPWRLDPEARSERREKDLAALARRGFSHDVAYKVIDAESPDDLTEAHLF